jgi:hypothetical protein
MDKKTNNCWQNTAQKTWDWTTQALLQTGGRIQVLRKPEIEQHKPYYKPEEEFRRSEKVSSVWSANGIHHVKNPVISHQRGKEVRICDYDKRNIFLFSSNPLSRGIKSRIIGVNCHFQQLFSSIVTPRLNAKRKPPTIRTNCPSDHL